MSSPLELLKAWATNIRGSVAIWSALSLPLVLGSAVLGIDYGYLTLQKRELQAMVDLAAISASSNIGDIEGQLIDYFAMNNKMIGVVTARGIKVPVRDQNFGGPGTRATLVAATDITGFSVPDGLASYTIGRYTSSLSVVPQKRFVPDETPYDAVRVTLTRKADLLLASGFFEAPVISVQGTASVKKLAAFSIGSRLASVDAGLLNAILGGLLGTSLSLKVMDYEQLAKVDIELLSFLEALNTQLSLNALTYSDILKTNIKLGTLLDRMGRAGGIGGAASQALNTLAKALGQTQLSVQLQEILSLGPLAQSPIGAADHLTVKAGLFDVLSAMAVAANGGKQVGIDLGASLPGVAKVALTLAIGQPPVETPSIAVGYPGATVRTAQTRVSLNVDVTGLSSILGLKLHVPFYLEVANAEAQLTDIQCRGQDPANAIVKVAAVPGVAAIALGTVDPTAFINFGRAPFVSKATLIDSLLLRATAKALVSSGNLSKTTLTFSASDIASGKTRSVSTRNTVTSLVQSLLMNLDLDVEVLFISLGTPKAVTAAVAETLSAITKPVDTLLYNLLLALGVRIGEADIRATGVACSQPALIQ